MSLSVNRTSRLRYLTQQLGRWLTYSASYLLYEARTGDRGPVPTWTALVRHVGPYIAADPQVRSATLRPGRCSREGDQRTQVEGRGGGWQSNVKNGCSSHYRELEYEAWRLAAGDRDVVTGTRARAVRCRAFSTGRCPPYETAALAARRHACGLRRRGHRGPVPEHISSAAEGFDIGERAGGAAHALAEERQEERRGKASAIVWPQRRRRRGKSP